MAAKPINFVVEVIARQIEESSVNLKEAIDSFISSPNPNRAEQQFPFFKHRNTRLNVIALQSVSKTVLKT